MNKMIYLVIIFIFFGVGFFNLESNNWKPIELPSVLLGTSEEKILPVEEWEDNLIGKWEFSNNYDWENIHVKGTVTYNADKTFIRKGVCEWIWEDTGEDGNAGGTVKGGWEVTGDKSWLEIKEYCKLFPEHTYFDACSIFPDTSIYGIKNDDTWDFDIVYFNNSRIEIRGKSLTEDEFEFFRFSRIE